MANHLWDPTTGLLYHAYDELGQQPWADPVTHRSNEFWCRGNGWYTMALVEMLDLLPTSHPSRPQMLAVLNGLATALERYQDPKTRRWFQVVDKGNLSANWVETSGSAMFAYGLSRAIQRGYIPVRYQETASLGYQGVVNTVSFGSDGLANITGTVTGGVLPPSTNTLPGPGRPTTGTASAPFSSCTSSSTSARSEPPSSGLRPRAPRSPRPSRLSETAALPVEPPFWLPSAPTARQRSRAEAGRASPSLWPRPALTESGVEH